MPRKRSPGDGALYFVKARNLWKGAVDLEPVDGKRQQKWVTHRTQAGARAKLEALKKEIAEHGAPLDKQTTVADWAEHWLATVCRPKLKPNTLLSYESLVRAWVLPSMGKKKVALLKPSDVRIVLDRVSKSGKASATSRKTYVVLTGMLEAARLDGLAPRNVAKDVSAPRVIKGTREALTTDEAMRALAAAADMPDGTRWWMAILEALRQSERLGATLEDLHLDEKTYTVQWALSEVPFEHGCKRVAGKPSCGRVRAGSCPGRSLRIPDAFEYRQLQGRLCLIRPKSGEPRTVPLLAPVVEALRRYLDSTAHIPNPHGLIWRNVDGSPILPDQDEQSWRGMLHAAGVISAAQVPPPRDRVPGTVDPMTSHSARHTTITVLTELGIDAKVIGEIVGHGSVEVTRGYQHVTTAVAREAMDRLGEHFAVALTRHATTRDSIAGSGAPS